MFFTKKQRARVDTLEVKITDLQRLYKEAIEVLQGMRPSILFLDHACGHASISYAKHRDGSTICLDCYNKQFPVKE